MFGDALPRLETRLKVMMSTRQFVEVEPGRPGSGLVMDEIRNTRPTRPRYASRRRGDEPPRLQAQINAVDYFRHIRSRRALCGWRDGGERLLKAANRVARATRRPLKFPIHATGLYPDWWDGWRSDKAGSHLGLLGNEPCAARCNAEHSYLDLAVSTMTSVAVRCRLMRL